MGGLASHDLLTGPIHGGDLPNRRGAPAPHRLVVTHDLPPELRAPTVARLIGALREVATVPPRVPRFEGEPQIGPCDVEVDLRTVGEAERVLPHRLGEPGTTGEVDEEQLQATRGRCRSPLGPLEPTLEASHAAAAPTADPLEVLCGRFGRDESEVPCVLGRALERSVAELTGEIEQGPVWARKPKVIRPSGSRLVVVPAGAHDPGPVGYDDRM